MEHYFDQASWAKRVYGQCDLGDKRRTKRLTSLAATLASQPSVSIPAACGGDTARQEGAYRFIENDLVDAAGIEEGTSKRILKDAEEQDVVLAIQDTTAVTYDHALRKQLGHTGSTYTRAMNVHSVLLVDPNEKGIIGLGAQKWWVRKKKRKSKLEYQKIPYEKKESFKWEETIGLLLSRTKRHDNLISVCDREADIYEFLQFHDDEQLRYVIRSNTSRNLMCGKGKLRGHLKKQPVLGTRNVIVQQRGPGVNKSSGKRRPPRSMRVAQTEIRACTVTLKPSGRGQTEIKRPLRVNAVLVTEVSCPVGTAPLDWLLLTTEKVDTFQQAKLVVSYYEQRWLIEEFHKCWKTGCALEKKRFQEVGNLERLMVILAPIAARLLHLRSVYESRPDASCSELMSKVEWVCLWLSANPKKRKPPSTAPTIKWALQAVARMAGWTDTKRTGRIGWETLWKGWMKLEDMADGFEVALHMQGVKM
jgi:Transposase DNA-binding/Transposase DDE domain